MERTNFGSNKILFFFPLTRIDFAALVSSRAVRISSRAVRVFPALSLRRVRPSYGTFPLMVLQGNCARGRTSHVINCISYNLVAKNTIQINVPLSYLVLVLHLHQLVFQISECWSFIWVIFPAFHHYLIPGINKNF